MALYNYNINISQNQADIINEFRNIDPSFESWMNKSNNITKEQIQNAYNIAVNYLKGRLKNMKNKSTKKEIGNMISTLSKLKKTKLEKLKKADKQILAFKKFRKTYKTCVEAIDLANTEVDNKNIKKISKDFLSGYKKLLDARHQGNITSEYSVDNLNKKSKEMLSKTKTELSKNREDKKLQNYLKSTEIWYRELLSKIGISKKEKARESNSGKFDLMGENDLSNWMSTMKNNVLLSDIIIPASHDSGAYSVVPTSNVDIFGEAAQTHTVNFRGQLRAGVRYFDLRMNLENGIPVMAHDIVNGAPVSEAIRQIIKFAKSHPEEIIIIEINHTSQECLQKFYKLPLVEELQQLVYKSQNKRYGNTTIGEVRESGKNVIMFQENSKEVIDIYNEEARQSSDEEMLKNELKNLVSNWTKNQENKRLHKITPTHCATVKDFFSKGKRWKPLWNAVEKSNGNYKFLLNSKEFRDFANVVSYDDAKGSVWFAKELIKLNTERMKNF